MGEILNLHDRLIAQWGGAQGLRDLGALESAAAQPRMTFGGDDLYPDLATKASALAFSLIQNHPFVDGNKRLGHAAMETFLVLNGFELGGTVAEAESMILGVASGDRSREDLVAWVRHNVVPNSRRAG